MIPNAGNFQDVINTFPTNHIITMCQPHLYEQAFSYGSASKLFCHIDDDEQSFTDKLLSMATNTF